MLSLNQVKQKNLKKQQIYLVKEKRYWHVNSYKNGKYLEYMLTLVRWQNLKVKCKNKNLFLKRKSKSKTIIKRRKKKINNLNRKMIYEL